MATLVNTNKNVAGAFNPVKNTLTAADVITFVNGANQELVFYNPTAAAVTVTIDGANGTTVVVPNTGTTVSVAAGLAITVPIAGFTVVRLDTISAYCQGVVALTGGTGLVAFIIE